MSRVYTVAVVGGGIGRSHIVEGYETNGADSAEPWKATSATVTASWRQSEGRRRRVDMRTF